MPFYGKIDRVDQFHRRRDQAKYSMSLISPIYKRMSLFLEISEMPHFRWF